MGVKKFFDREKLNFFKRWWRNLDKTLLILILFLMLFGVIMSITASPSVAEKIGLDPDHFVKKHFFFSIVSLVVMLFLSFMSKNNIKLFAVYAFLGALCLLLLVPIIGVNIKGGQRWIFLMGFSLQPSEFVKTLFCIVNAIILQRFCSKPGLQKFYVSFFVYLFIATLLIIQPDLGMTLTLTLIWLGQIFLAGLSLGLVYLMAFGGVMMIIMAYIFLPHVTDRINRYLAAVFGATGENYQVERSMEAINRGGFMGKGPVEGVLKQNIPDAHTDFVFSVVGEEFGLIFCILILSIVFTIIYKVMYRMRHERDKFIYLAAMGLILQITFQSLVNVGVTLNLLPTKGMTLPFVSYGGSSMLAIAICFGSILALTKKRHTYHRKLSDILLFR